MGLSIVSAKSPADPLREALAAALQQSAEAKSAVDRQRSAIERTRASVRTAEKAVKTAEENVGKAQEVYAQALADAAACDAPAPTSGVRTARQAVVDLQDEVLALKDALQTLKKDLPAWEAQAREADIAVEAAISVVLVPQVQELVSKGCEIARHLAPIRQTLFAHLTDNTATGVVDVAAFHKGRGPLLGIEKEVRELLYSANAINETQPNPWLEARERLRADPFAPLPDLETSRSPTAA